MNETKNSLSEADRGEERLYDLQLLEFFQRKLDSMSLSARKALHCQTSEVVDEALRKLTKKLRRMPDVVFKDSELELKIRWGYHPVQYAFTSLDKGIEWGSANPESQEISLLTVIAFAPKEIIREIVTHEALHLVYRFVDPACIRTETVLSQTVLEYPEKNQQDEQWVRDMTGRMGFKEGLLALWEVAVETGGDDWRPRYYELKRVSGRMV